MKSVSHTNESKLQNVASFGNLFAWARDYLKTGRSPHLSQNEMDEAGGELHKETKRVLDRFPNVDLKVVELAVYVTGDAGRKGFCSLFAGKKSDVISYRREVSLNMHVTEDRGPMVFCGAFYENEEFVSEINAGNSEIASSANDDLFGHIEPFPEAQLLPLMQAEEGAALSVLKVRFNKFAAECAKSLVGPSVLVAIPFSKSYDDEGNKALSGVVLFCLIEGTTLKSQLSQIVKSLTFHCLKLVSRELSKLSGAFVDDRVKSKLEAAMPRRAFEERWFVDGSKKVGHDLNNGKIPFSDTLRQYLLGAPSVPGLVFNDNTELVGDWITNQHNSLHEIIKRLVGRYAICHIPPPGLRLDDETLINLDDKGDDPQKGPRPLTLGTVLLLAASTIQLPRKLNLDLAAAHKHSILSRRQSGRIASKVVETILRLFTILQYDRPETPCSVEDVRLHGSTNECLTFVLRNFQLHPSLDQSKASLFEKMKEGYRNPTGNLVETIHDFIHLSAIYGDDGDRFSDLAGNGQDKGAFGRGQFCSLELHQIEADQGTPRAEIVFRAYKNTGVKPKLGRSE
jgi:hypothetical protein